jgi:hypothetical protein
MVFELYLYVFKQYKPKNLNEMNKLEFSKYDAQPKYLVVCHFFQSNGVIVNGSVAFFEEKKDATDYLYRIASQCDECTRKVFKDNKLIIQLSLGKEIYEIKSIFKVTI